MDDERAGSEAGDRVGRYVLRERLGAGGMGVVHAAWDPELDRRVAIKLIRRGRAVSPELLRRRLRREAQAMARLRHPNVVQVYDVGESDGQLFVAMEYVDGVSLRKWLKQKSRSVADILEVFRAAGEGLAAAHAEGLIHRDFKPDNVIVANDGKVMVLDFGLASWANAPASDGGDSSENLSPAAAEMSPPKSSSSIDQDETLTKTGAVLGTPNYMAPEQQRGQGLDARSDQFAFCVALWQALTGELPYGQSSIRSLARARVGRLGKLPRKGVPARVERALRRGLAWRAEDRWPDMHGLLDALARPNRRRWWAAVPVAFAAGFAVLWQLDAAQPGRDCESHSERVHEVWNDNVSAELARTFDARGELARTSWPFVEAELERFATRWVEIDGELCSRYGNDVTPELHERQLLCLDRALDHFGLAVAVLEGASADEIEHSFELLARLPDPASCRDAALAEQRADTDPRKFAELEREIDRVEFEQQLGRMQRADEASAELMPDTNVPGYEHLHVRLAAIRSGLLGKLDRRDEAIDVAFSGLAAAEREGSVSLRLRAFIDLVQIHTNIQDLAGAERWLAQAKTIAAEHGAKRQLQRDLDFNEGWVVAMGGRLDDGLAAFDRALALTDPQTERLEHAQLVIARAQLLGWLDRPGEALEQFLVGEEEFVNLIGPGHPEVLDLRIAKAGILMRLGQHEPARSEILDASDLLDAVRGGPTTTTVAARARAAWLRDKLGDCKGALAEYDPLLPAAREKLPYPSPDLGDVLSRRAELCDHKAPRAIEFAREALALYREAVGDQHVMVAAARTRLARTLLENGEFEPAREEIDTALSIYAAVAPIGAELVPETRALQMLIRHAQQEPGALDGIDQLIATLPKGHRLTQRLAALR